MIEINDGKIAVIHEIGLITNISKFHNPQNNQVMYNVTIMVNMNAITFPISKDLFEQWILGINKAMNELNEARIIKPNLELHKVSN